MKNNKENLIENVILKYNDGTEEKINKGAVITFGEVDENGDANLTLKFANCNGDDLVKIVWSILCMSNDMGILDELLENLE